MTAVNLPRVDSPSDGSSLAFRDDPSPSRPGRIHTSDDSTRIKERDPVTKNDTLSGRLQRGCWTLLWAGTYPWETPTCSTRLPLQLLPIIPRLADSIFPIFSKGNDFFSTLPGDSESRTRGPTAPLHHLILHPVTEGVLHYK